MDVFIFSKLIQQYYVYVFILITLLFMYKYRDICIPEDNKVDLGGVISVFVVSIFLSAIVTIVISLFIDFVIIGAVCNILFFGCIMLVGLIIKLLIFIIKYIIEGVTI